MIRPTSRLLARHIRHNQGRLFHRRSKTDDSKTAPYIAIPDTTSAPPTMTDQPATMPSLHLLKEHFDAIPPAEQAGGWDALWQKGITQWDRHAPSPALVDALSSHAAATFGSPLLSTSSSTTTTLPSRKRALVPGCGAGYDVFLLAAHGYDAYGLDVSTTALSRAAALQASPGFATAYPVADPAVGRGAATFLQADFFDDDFRASIGGGEAAAQRFDFIYDYTFLCALPPVTRPRWAARMSELLAPIGGWLVCLEWPLAKSVLAGGPPHGLEPAVYERLLEAPGREVEYDPVSGKVQKRSGGGEGKVEAEALVRVKHWRAQRTHKEGKGEECVSIWRHRMGEEEKSCAECD